MTIKKHMEVAVDVRIAREMLRIAGYYDINGKTDEEVFDLAINMSDCYGVRFEERKEENGTT